MFSNYMLWNEEKTIEYLINSLHQNKISIVSTDTIFGFIASLNEKSFKKLNTLKGLRNEKPYLMLIESKLKLPIFVAMETINIKIKNLIDHCWPGPLTIVFQAKKNLAAHLISTQGTIALRCPNHEGLIKLLHNFDGLYSTSVNKSGQPSACTIDQIPSEFINQIDCIINDPKKNTQPSTIIDASNLDGRGIKVLRVGAYSIDELKSICGDILIKL